MNNYKLDDNFNFVPISGAGKSKKLLNRTQNLNVIDEINNYEKTGEIVKGGFLFDLLATGANMIKNGIEGKRWSDNTVFKGLGKGKAKGGCKCLKEVHNFETSGKLVKGGFLLDFLATGINMIKNGIEGKRWSENTPFQGLGKVDKPKRKASPAQKKRGELVKRVMKEYGVSLGEASKMIKQAGL
ncbi:MV08 [Cafeteriavirus-dependent mavirus]|nr:MV08 [Cafeteriavirus-dependent mavirus]CAK6624538.1 MV08 [Cafeteriavirus-dependent mavirus]